MVRDIRYGSIFSRRYLVLLALSTAIASFGLLGNSSAVIIGAMIIAPLMGPILGLALGAVTFNLALEKRAFGAEAIGVVVAIGIGFLAGLLPANLGISEEMMARTAPTVYDLFIAFASGLAGAFCSVNKKINNALAGVAISVALVPPLATCGILFAMGELGLSLGALLLFLANFFCIQAASVLVFLLYGLNNKAEMSSLGAVKFGLRFAPNMLALGAMAWFMTGTLQNLVRQHQFESKLVASLSRAVARKTGGRLDGLPTWKDDGGVMRVVAVVLTPVAFDSHQVAQMETLMRGQVDPRISLIVRSVVSRDVDRNGAVFVSHEERANQQELTAFSDLLSEARGEIVTALDAVQGASLSSLERSGEGTSVLLTATIQTPRQIDPEEVGILENLVRERLKTPVKLVVRSVLTRDADRSGYIYEPIPEIDIEREQLRERIRAVVTKRLGESGMNASSIECRFLGEDIEVRADAECVAFPEPAVIEQLRSDLKRHVDPRIKLLLRTALSQTWKG